MKIQLSKKDLALIKHILALHLPKNAKVWLFGSRVSDKIKPFSDVDLLLDVGSQLSSNILINLAEEFDESDLAYKVDLVDKHSIEKSFSELISKEAILVMG
jgi:predicted nucleotidyltransferase